MEDNGSPDSDIDRRTVMKGAVAAGGAIGVGGLFVAATGAQENGDPDTVEAEFCDQFSPGPQVQQCLSCIEDECGEEEVFPLFPLFTGLSGQCFTPEEIPEGAQFVALKAAQNCYIAPVDDYTTFCVPDGEPDISNATFYRCGGDPTPIIVEKTVTCDEITVTTENIDDDTELSATVTYVDADGEESEDTITATVVNNQATFTLDGDLNPVHVQIFLGDDLLDDQEPEVEGAPCFPDPAIVEKTVTCDEISITTENIDDNTELTATVTYVDGDGEESTATHDATVEANQATFTLLGDLNPVFVVITVNDEVIDEQEIKAEDAPCFEPDPDDPKDPKDPEDPKKPENRKEARKKMEKYRSKMEKCDKGCKEYRQKYEKYKKMYEKME